ncbi:hypothetical protein GCM10023093_14260 [Nemorincola caseinilytica]|uniref:Acyloxyacyl hydrolase n=2 Tax=Nemorincola caseinilytica TaxID=2054315 RepID=A0ABP8NF79_9BACT
MVIHAQGTSAGTGFGIQASLLAGKVFKHEAKFTLPIPTLTTGADANLVWRTYGRKEWQQRRHYPRLGLGITGMRYGIDSVYGSVFGIYPNITLPLAKTPSLEWTLRLGTGISYVTRRFDRTGPVNTVNVAISAHVNDLIMLRSDAEYHLSDHYTIHAGAFLTHISNGSVRKPNLGVNVAGITAGISYYPVTSRPALLVRDLRPLPARYLFQLRYSMSLVSAYTWGGPLYPVYITTAYASRRWRSHNKVFAGLDLSYHQSINAFLRNNGLEAGHEPQRSYKAALLAGNEFLLGRVGITLQAGVYIRQAYLRREDVYQKVTLNYYCIQREHGALKELFFFTGLKTHLNVAEMGELGIGLGL